MATKKPRLRCEATFYHLVTAMVRVALEHQHLEEALTLVATTEDYRAPGSRCQYLDLLIQANWEYLRRVPLAELDRTPWAELPRYWQELVTVFHEVQRAIAAWLVSAPVWQLFHKIFGPDQVDDIWHLEQVDLRQFMSTAVVLPTTAPRLVNWLNYDDRFTAVALDRVQKLQQDVRRGRELGGDGPGIDLGLQVIATFRLSVVEMMLADVDRLDNMDLLAPVNTGILANRVIGLALRQPRDHPMYHASLDALRGDAAAARGLLDWLEEQGRAVPLAREFLDRVVIAPTTTAPVD